MCVSLPQLPGMQIASFLSRIILPSGLPDSFFPHYAINGTIFERKKFLERAMCGLVFSTNFSEAHLILRRTERYYHECTLRLHIRYPLFLTGFHEFLIFSSDFRKILKYQISRKSETRIKLYNKLYKFNLLN